ncbi:MAG TPA: c-type cytochrome [Steroidobacteraceae bacterium]|jgi:mono/diheme cytochrome c family protein/small nuclear ribonucleoprotein (snRNP)-like protein
MSFRAHSWVHVSLVTVAGLALTGICGGVAASQAPAKAPDGPVGNDYGRPPLDPAAVARGKQVFSVNCGFCHGSGARGGEGGPNILRSPMVLNDLKGEILAVVVQNGRLDKGMPKFDLDTDAIGDIAAYLHSIPAGRVEAPFDPKSILIGDAAAGKAYFYGKGKCSQCHSLKGDFAGIGSKYDAKTLQDNIISGAAVTPLGAPVPTAPPRTVTVTLASGTVISGTLISIDDFNVTLTDAAGERRSLRRKGDTPRVEVKDPMQAHLDMLREWEDRDIHNLTAFLVKQK